MTFLNIFWGKLARCTFCSSFELRLRLTVWLLTDALCVKLRGIKYYDLVQRTCNTLKKSERMHTQKGLYRWCHRVKIPYQQAYTQKLILFNYHWLFNWWFSFYFFTLTQRISYINKNKKISSWFFKILLFYTIFPLNLTIFWLIRNLNYILLVICWNAHLIPAQITEKALI